METVNLAGAKCLRFANEEIEILIATDFGPRILGLSLLDGENLLKACPEDFASAEKDEFKLYGGHRLWAAPEVAGFTDEPDNEPVEIAEEDGLIHIAGPEGKSGLQKSLTIEMDGSSLAIDHEIVNVSDLPVRVAPWALTVMAPGGECLIAQPPYVPHGASLSPTRPIVQWSYTHMGDSRFTWGSKVIRFRHDSAQGPNKFGAFCSPGVAVYWRTGIAFIKKFEALEGVEYPDMGCNFESFARQEMLEVESLGPMRTLMPGDSCSHVEVWSVIEAPAPPADDAACKKWFEKMAQACPDP